MNLQSYIQKKRKLIVISIGKRDVKMKNYIKCGICKGRHNVGSKKFKRCQKRIKKYLGADKDV